MSPEFYKFSNWSEPMALELRNIFLVSSSKFKEEKESQFSNALSMDADSVVKSASEGDINALAAILINSTNLEAKTFPNVFLMSCQLLSPAKLRTDASSLETFRHAVLALFTLASFGMSQAIEHAPPESALRFTKLIAENISQLFQSMEQLFYHHRDGRYSSFPFSRMQLASLMSDALSSLFGNAAALGQLKMVHPIRKFLWKLWLYGGPPTYDENTYIHYCAAAACIKKLYTADGGQVHPSAFPDLMEVCDTESLGGQEAAVNLIFTALHRALLSKTFILDASCYALVLTMFYGPKWAGRAHPISKTFDDSNGFELLIEGLTELATSHRARIQTLEADMDITAKLLISILRHLITRHHRKIEKAGRVGVLQMLVAFGGARTDTALPKDVVQCLNDLLDILPRYFVYHSVLVSFSEQMHQLTEGDFPKDIFISTNSDLSVKWRQLKRALFDRYVTMRFYDIIIEEAARLRPNPTILCNNCGEAQGETKFRHCSACKMVYYCSKNCQTEDWKSDGHREDCSKKNERFIKDIPFLCFLANFYVYPRFLVMLQQYPAVPLSRAVVRAHFCYSFLEPSLDIVDIDLATKQLEDQVQASGHGKSCNMKNSLPEIKVTTSEPESASDTNDKKAPISYPPIQIVVLDRQEVLVVRHVAMDRETRKFQGGIASAPPASVRKPQPGDCVYTHRINPVMEEGKLMKYDQDVVDRLLLSMKLGDDGDPWLYHLSDVNKQRGGTRKFAHAVDYVNEFMRMERLPFSVQESGDGRVIV